MMTPRQPPSPIVVVPVQAGDPDRRDVLPLFLMPSDGDENAGLRRLGKALGAEWPVSLVRPRNYWHDLTRYAMEDAARAAAAVIRAARPRVPFVVGGFCLGGVIAFETARLLADEGCAGLVLFDTPVPGYPKLTPRALRKGALGRFVRAARHERSSPDWKHRMQRLGVRKSAWYGILLARPLLGPLWHKAWLKDIVRGAQVRDAPFFRLRKLQVPVLHFLADAVGNRFIEEARLDWELAAGRGVTYASVSGRHETIFFRPNLPILAAEIRKWSATLLDPPPAESKPS